MQTTRTFTDQMGRTVHIPWPVKRIVSLVPSQTELLVDLGLESLLVGVTRFCIHPKGLKHRIPQVGGTKAVKLDKVRELQPDLIIGNKEENFREDIEALAPEFPVWMSDIATLAEALDMIEKVGELTGTVDRADSLVKAISQEFQELSLWTEGKKEPRKVLYLIWRNPWMAAGTGTFIDDCMQRLGWQNCAGSSRYPEIDCTSVDPDLVLLSSEPYPFKGTHIAELRQHFPKASIVLADGEYFSWYGSRLLGAPTYFRALIEQLRLSEQSEKGM